MPTATTSRRGTRYSVFYDRVARAALVAVTQGTVEVDPTKAGLPTLSVTVGKEVEVTRTAVSALVGIGKAGARGGVNRATALGLVLKTLGRANGPCGFTAKRGSAFSVLPAPTGWTVSVVVTGKVSGTSKWTLTGKNVVPANALAKTIAANCR